MTAWGWIVCCCQIWTLISIANFFVWVNCFVSSVQLCDYNTKKYLTNRKNYLSPSTRRSPGSESSRKVCAAYFLCHCCQMKWFFKNLWWILANKLPLIHPSSWINPSIANYRVKGLQYYFHKIGRRSKTQATGPNPLASDFSQKADRGGYKCLRAA